MYEILRLRVTDMSDEEQAKQYRLEVKRRLFGPYRVRFYAIRAPEFCKEGTKMQSMGS